MTIEKPMATQRISAAEFKAKCLHLMEQVSKNRRPIIITKRGKPIAKLVPIDKTHHKGFGCMRGTVTINGDIISHLDEPWDTNNVLPA
jgi:prevent-host-death family protein